MITSFNFSFHFSFPLKLPFQNRSHNQLCLPNHLIMDQSIICQNIYSIYHHPLSILIHLKFQDKDGCSKNGSREFLKNVSLLGEAIDPITNPHVIGTNSQLAHFDHRGVAYKLILKGYLERGMKQFEDDELLCELEN